MNAWTERIDDTWFESNSVTTFVVWKTRIGIWRISSFGDGEYLPKSWFVFCAG